VCPQTCRDDDGRNVFVSRRVRIFDVTSRDGEQSPGTALRPPKAEIDPELEGLSVDVVETGSPGTEPGDVEGTTP
jgi:isopropylmalate/homocitrate/citramalate synthase